MTDERDLIAEVVQNFYDPLPFVGDIAKSVADDIVEELHKAGFRILGPDEVAALQKALATAEDHAGTLPAREAVKLRPADWHALAAAIRSLKGGRNA